MFSTCIVCENLSVFQCPPLLLALAPKTEITQVIEFQFREFFFLKLLLESWNPSAVRLSNLRAIVLLFTNPAKYPNIYSIRLVQVFGEDNHVSLMSTLSNVGDPQTFEWNVSVGWIVQKVCSKGQPIDNICHHHRYSRSLDLFLVSLVLLRTSWWVKSSLRLLDASYRYSSPSPSDCKVDTRWQSPLLTD